jgi:hypothetical protein
VKQLDREKEEKQDTKEKIGKTMMSFINACCWVVVKKSENPHLIFSYKKKQILLYKNPHPTPIERIKGGLHFGAGHLENDSL